MRDVCTTFVRDTRPRQANPGIDHIPYPTRLSIAPEHGGRQPALRQRCQELQLSGLKAAAPAAVPPGGPVDRLFPVAVEIAHAGSLREHAVLTPHHPDREHHDRDNGNAGQPGQIHTEKLNLSVAMPCPGPLRPGRLALRLFR